MTDFKKWIKRCDEDGFINKEHEKLDKILMISSGIVIGVVFISLIVWSIVESKKTI